MGSILKKKQFDTFYHEHPRTYSLTSFIFIAKLLKLNILAVEFPKRYGGNIRVLMGPKNLKNKYNFKNKLKNEKKFYNQFLKMGKKIEIWRKIKSTELKKMFNKYGKIPAKGFPGRASILIKLLGLNEKIISNVYEKPNSLKVGYYVPGTLIPIKSDLTLFKNINRNKIILNLAWHIKDEIVKYLKKNNYKGKIINILD